MKLEVLVTNEKSLKVLAETKFSNAQLTWDLSESFDKISNILVKFQKTREEIIKKYGKSHPSDPERFDIFDVKSFEEEMQNILNVEVDVVFPTFTLNDLKNAEISTNDMMSWKALGIIVSE